MLKGSWASVSGLQGFQQLLAVNTTPLLSSTLSPSPLPSPRHRPPLTKTQTQTRKQGRVITFSISKLESLSKGDNRVILRNEKIVSGAMSPSPLYDWNFSTKLN
nr:hypothetical protein BgiMline_006559 [Biomphalaria glabrata]